MRTLNRGDWTYGRLEMRARMPIGQGIWPAFWMLPTDEFYGGRAASGEIDVAEYLGHKPDEIIQALHHGGPWPGNVSWSSAFTLPVGSFNDGFHDFALEWGPLELRWYVDGIRVACQSHWHSTAGAYPAPGTSCVQGEIGWDAARGQPTEKARARCLIRGHLLVRGRLTRAER